MKQFPAVKISRKHIAIFSFLAASLFFSLSPQAQSVTKKFLTKYTPLADSLSEAWGIPTAIILGTAIIESSTGTGRNARLLNNYFGVVGKNNLLKTKGIKTRYKQYPSDTASFADFCKVLSHKKYYPKLKGNPHYKLWIDAISKAGYSEDAGVWKREVTGAIQRYKLSNTP